MVIKHSRELKWAEYVFVVFIAICIALEPRFFFRLDQGGVSNYGTVLATIVPFTIAFLVPIVALTRVSFRLSPEQTKLKNIMLLLSASMFLVLATTYTYKMSEFLGLLHEKMAILAFISALVVAIYAYKNHWGDKQIRLTVYGIGLGMLAGALSFFGSVTVLMFAEILTFVATINAVRLCVKDEE